jgi:hypothetical protein
VGFEQLVEERPVVDERLPLRLRIDDTGFLRQVAAR